LAISENSTSSEETVEKIDNGGVGRDVGGEERKQVVKMDAHGNPIYDSNSLKRKKGAITTFSPGPCVKEGSSSSCTTVESITIADEAKKFIGENHNRKSSIESQNSQIYRRTNQIVRPVVPQRNPKEVTCEVEDKNNNNINNQMTSNNHLMRPNGSLSLNLNSVSSKVLANSNMRGAYVNVQDSAPLRNGPPVYSPPSPSRAALIFGQPQQQEIDPTPGKNRAPKIVDFTPKAEQTTTRENIDPNMMRAHVKRSNSYRMAAIYADPNDLSAKRKSLLESSDDEPYMNISKNVTRSFEKLIEEFSKSSSAIISTDVMLNESLDDNQQCESVKRYSLEPPKLIDLNDYMTDSSFDDVIENDCITSKSPLHIPSPSKVTLPSDSAKHKARIVLMKNFDTEIW
jgi:hypothetical protein